MFFSFGLRSHLRGHERESIINQDIWVLILVVKTTITSQKYMDDTKLIVNLNGNNSNTFNSFCFLCFITYQSSCVFNVNVIAVKERQWCNLNHSWRYWSSNSMSPKMNVIARLEFEPAQSSTLTIILRTLPNWSNLWWIMKNFSVIINTLFMPNITYIYWYISMKIFFFFHSFDICI